MLPPSITGKLDRALTLPLRMARRERLWLPITLFALTFATTTIIGAALAHGFETNHPIDLEQEIAILTQLPARPWLLISGLPFSLTLLAILLAHEFGHYLTCARYRIDASLPYFLPAPTLIGTLGAFIRIRSPIYTRRALFDVGIAGPLAGFAVLLPALIVGLLESKVVPGVAARGDFIFGTPALVRLLEFMLFPGTPTVDIYLHPVARAAWVGILATALNLLPIGQLDGGHILYSLLGDKHRILSWVFVLGLIPIGLFYSWTWLLWAAVLTLFGLRHQVICDPTSVGPTRVKLGWAALAMFLLCFTVAPIRTGG